MKTIATIILTLAVVHLARAQFKPGDALVARSVSGQFQASARKTDIPSRFALANTNSILLEPGLLVVSCERIKQALTRELGASTHWEGKIYLHLQSARSPNSPVTIVARKLLGKWTYHVQLPDSLDKTGFLQAIVQVLLLEMSNRNNPAAHLAEIPLWLTQGLSQQLLASNGGELLLPSPGRMENGLSISRLMIDAIRNDPLEHVQATLRVRPPLTFEQLSWPGTEWTSGPAAEVFRCSAQLFVSQLLRLPEGPGSFCAMLDELPRHYNWQFAFLKGFRPHFERLLDVEKWWALQVVQFTGRDLMQTWTLEESWKKLDEILLSTIHVRPTPDDLPLRRDVSLQTIVRDGDLLQQTQVLQRKLRELDFLRLRVSQKLVWLVDDYRQLIETYLRTPNLSGSLLPVRRQNARISGGAAGELIRQLDLLDARRETLRSELMKPVTDTANTGP